MKIKRSKPVVAIVTVLFVLFINQAFSNNSSNSDSFLPGKTHLSPSFSGNLDFTRTTSSNAWVDFDGLGELGLNFFLAKNLTIKPSFLLGLASWEETNYSSDIVFATYVRVSPEIRLSIGYFFQYTKTQSVIPFVNIFGLTGFDLAHTTFHNQEPTIIFFNSAYFPVSFNLLRITFRTGVGLEAGVLISLGANHFLSLSISDIPPFLHYVVSPRFSLLTEEFTLLRFDSHIIKLKLGVTIALGK